MAPTPSCAAGTRRYGAQALNVLASPLLHGNRQAIFARTTQLRMPSIYQWPDTAHEGALLAYGPRFAEVMRQLGPPTDQGVEGSQSGRAAGRAADQVRIGREPQDRDGDRARLYADAACPRRRGGRVTRVAPYSDSYVQTRTDALQQMTCTIALLL